MFRLILIFVLVNLSFSENIRLALSPFDNKTDRTTLEFLSAGLSEEFSSHFQTQNGFELLERSQLNKIMEELSLTQSGLIEDESPNENVKLLKADYLIVGSYSGISSSLHLSVKVIQIKTGKIITQSTLSGTVESVMESIGGLAQQISLKLLNPVSSTLNLITQPSDALVIMDGKILGRSPLKNFPLQTGFHQFEIQLDEYFSSKFSLDINSDSNAVFKQVVLEAKPAAYRPRISVSAISLQLQNLPFTKAGGAELGVGARFNKVFVDISGGLIKNLDHSYRIASINENDSSLEDNRKMNYYQLGLDVGYIPFDFKYFSPYIKVNVSNHWIEDYSPDKHYLKNRAFSSFQSFQAAVGIELFPRAILDVYSEISYTKAFKAFQRVSVKQIGITGPQFINQSHTWEDFRINFGLRICL